LAWFALHDLNGHASCTSLVTSNVPFFAVLCCIWCRSEAAAQLQPGESRKSSRRQTRVLTQAPAAAPKANPQFESAFSAMLGLPEGKVIRDTYLNTFGTMSDPNMRAKFQGILTLATVSVTVHLMFALLSWHNARQTPSKTYQVPR
jgi:hypothetical protein